jgi:hypothetical protein
MNGIRILKVTVYLFGILFYKYINTLNNEVTPIEKISGQQRYANNHI